MRLSITTLFLFFCLLGFSQTDRTTELEEIILKGNFSKSINIGHTVESISDSILRSSYESLGNLLQNNSNLYFKQNGNGMVSSISLRGTLRKFPSSLWIPDIVFRRLINLPRASSRTGGSILGSSIQLFRQPVKRLSMASYGSREKRGIRNILFSIKSNR